MSRTLSARRLRVGITATAVLGATAATLSLHPVGPASADPSGQPAPRAGGTEWDRAAYRGQVQVVPPDDNSSQRVLRGKVFIDADRDSRSDNGEKGKSGVLVTNGRDVVTTDKNGEYSLPAFDNMTVSVTQPAGFQVPVDDDNIAQFSYNHLPEGSPQLKYGGIEPTGRLPEAVNFPLVKEQATKRANQDCVIAGDLQTYDKEEVGYARAGAISDLADREDYGSCGALFIGDIVGDDLSLYPDVRGLVGQLNGPVRFLPGNHDLDFDADDAAHSFDTYRAQLAPEYYSYDVGKTHVVALNTVRYPCTPDVDNVDGQKPECDNPETKPAYNGRLSEDQMHWLAADLAQVPKDKLVVVASHIPLLTFADANSARHQVDQLLEIHELLEGREAVAVAGHTHTLENMKEGDLFQGWEDIFGIEGLPFPHIVAGAISGDWYSGAVTEKGYPVAVGRDGARPGILTLNISGNQFQERFTLTGESDDVQMQLGINSPHFRQWYADRVEWNETEEGPAPKLGDGRLVSREDLAGETWLTTNFWMGSTGSEVEVSIDGEPAVVAERTQPAQGEDQKVGPKWSDPHAIAQQLVNGGSPADRTMHLWRLKLPGDLAVGTHRAKVTATDSYGRQFTSTMPFQVVEER